MVSGYGSCQMALFVRVHQNTFMCITMTLTHNELCVRDLETINYWGELSDVFNATRTLNRTSETPTIGRSDIANIRKDAQRAIQIDEKNKNNNNNAKTNFTGDGLPGTPSRESGDVSHSRESCVTRNAHLWVCTTSRLRYSY